MAPLCFCPQVDFQTRHLSVSRRCTSVRHSQKDIKCHIKLSHQSRLIQITLTMINVLHEPNSARHDLACALNVFSKDCVCHSRSIDFKSRPLGSVLFVYKFHKLYRSPRCIIQINCLCVSAITHSFAYKRVAWVGAVFLFYRLYYFI